MGDFKRNCVECGRMFWPGSERALECNGCWNRKNRRASARAEPRKPKVSYADIKAAFERNKEGL